MGYATLAGMPPEAGLYAAPLALLAYAIFGSSRHLFVGPNSAVAILSLSTVSVLADEGSEEFIALTILLALIVGVIMVIAGIARLGWVSDFMAKPVLDGFIIGLAMIIVLGQFDAIFGVEASGNNFWLESADLIGNLGDTNLETALVGLGALALLFMFAKYVPRLPGALTVVVVGIIIVPLFGLEDRGVALIGDIPAGLPNLGLPDLSVIEGGDVVALVPGAFGIVLVGYAESLAVGRKYGKKNKYEIDPDQELIGVGLANAGAGLAGGFVVSGSLSKTAAGGAAGQKSQMVSLMNVALVLVTLIALTPLFEGLPDAILAAIIIRAVWHLIDFGKLHQFWNTSHFAFLAATVCLLGVLTIDILPGLILAVVLSLGVVIYQVSRPRIPRLGKAPDHDLYRDADEHPDHQTFPGLIIVRIEAGLFFANAEHFRARVHQLIQEAEPAARALLVDCEGMYVLDFTAAEMLSELATELKEEDVQLLLTRVKPPVEEMLRRTGVEDIAGQAGFLTVTEAVEEYQRRNPRASS
jgi:high affinity sulfate transporter 1